MKLRLLLLLFGITSTVYTQNTSENTNKDDLQKYFLTTQLNDTVLVYGKKQPIEKLRNGFKVYNEYGHFLGIRVVPDYWNTLLFEGTSGKTTILKSLPLENISLYVNQKKIFFDALIQNSEKDINNGKVDLYYAEFYVDDIINYDYTPVHDSKLSGSPISRISTIATKLFYFKDLNGFHLIKNRSDFKRYPNVLGKELYDKMKKSRIEESKFLFDYFNKYNNKLDTSISL